MYAKVINEETKQCEVGTGTNTDFYKSIGMTEMDVEQAYNGGWYVKGFAPEKPEPTHEDVAQIRASEYQAKVDPITSHISRLRDKEQTEEVIAEIAELISERDALVEQIKAEHPYPEEQEQEQKEEKE